MGFDEAESEAATQEIQLAATDVSSTAAAQQLKFVKFQNVSKLTVRVTSCSFVSLGTWLLIPIRQIFVMTNQGDVDQTKISKIELFGSSQNSASEASDVAHPHSAAEYEQLKLSSRGKVFVVQFSAEWCGPCKAISPLFAQLARKYDGKAVFVHVDAEKLADISDTNDVRAFPTFKFFDKNGNLVHRFEGADSDALQRAVAQFTR